MLSAILEEPSFTEAMDNLFNALLKSQPVYQRLVDSGRIPAGPSDNDEFIQDDFIKSIEKHSRLTLISRQTLSDYLLRTAAEKFLSACSAAMLTTEKNHSMDEIIIYKALEETEV